MAKKNTGLDSAPKRARLTPSKNPYWQSVGGSRSGEWLGYRRAAGGFGTWIAKVIIGKRKVEARLAQADDAGHGAGELAYPAAVAAALAWAKDKRAEIVSNRSGEVVEAVSTVENVIAAYVAGREKRAPSGGRDARWRLTKHVLKDAKLAPLELPQVKATDLAAWRRRLPTEMRPATLNRLLNDVRAALATAYPGGVLPLELRSRLKAEADATEAREVTTLPAPVITRLIDASLGVDEHFGMLVLVLAATGARLSQISRLTVGDVQLAAGRIMVPSSAKGRASKARKPTAVPVGADILARLAPLVGVRPANAPLLLQKSGQPWTFAAQMSRPWRAACVAAGLPRGTVPYDLRHSSIVRALAAGVAIRFVAMTHDTSVAMIERHYSRFITSEVEAAARGAIVPLAPAAVVQLRAVG